MLQLVEFDQLHILCFPFPLPKFNLKSFKILLNAIAYLIYEEPHLPEGIEIFHFI